jgi:uncharacterized protein (DUF885 family)
METFSTPPEQQLEALLQEEWDFRLQEDPIFATYTGDHRHDHRLGGTLPEDFQRQASQMRSFLERLEKIDPAQLSAGSRVNYAIFQRDVSGRMAEIELGFHTMPVSRNKGPHLNLPHLAEVMPLLTPQDYWNYVARLRDIRRFMSELIELMRTGLRQGYSQPRVVVENIGQTLSAHLVERAEDSPFYTPFRRFPGNFPASERRELQSAGGDAVLNSVVPAYAALKQFLEAEYVPAARESIACSALPRGQEMYADRIRWFTTLDLTPQEVYETGISEVARIRREMEEVMTNTGFKGSLQEFFKFLRTDAQFYAKTPADLMKEVALLMKTIDGTLPRFFKTLPRMPYGLKETPADRAPFSTSGYYHPASGDGTSAGMYFVNTYDLKSRPLYEFTALSIHEAVPGHHLQRALQQELEGLPAMRRYYEAPAFEEGWALYCERLGLEMDLYNSPYNNFGRLVFEMWRAARLVVDPGMHYFGWSREKAVDFMAQNTALSQLNISNEINRYIAWPAQAVGYKIGELKIRELRAQAEQALGERFDLREFHDTLLYQGEVPMDILAQTVTDWIKAKK